MRKKPRRKALSLRKLQFKIEEPLRADSPKNSVSKGILLGPGRRSPDNSPKFKNREGQRFSIFMNQTMVMEGDPNDS